MTGDVHAYRASEELAAAILSRSEVSHRFALDVVKAWDDEHPDTKTLWSSSAFSLNRRCVGFSDPGGPVPEGLSRNQQRQELIPKRGKAGDEWREVTDRCNQQPQMEAVFKQFGVESIVWSGHRVCSAGIVETPDGVFVTWSAPHPEPGEHLTEVPLSEYYAAIEQRDREKAS